MCTKHLHNHFWVVAVLNNPCRFKRRIQLFREFISRMKTYDVNIAIVEVAYGDRNFETDDIDAPVKVQLRTNTVLWQKENMINIGISRLPKDWKYVAWIDTDIDFVNKDWVNETIQQLQHHSVVQLFEDSLDLGPNNEIIKNSKSFMYCYKNNIETAFDKTNSYYYAKCKNNGIYWHPGYAWAATREAIDTVGGLFEVGIVGSGDHHMACSLIGDGKQSLAKGLSNDYSAHLLNWEKRALRLHKNVGYVKGTIYHYWHGKKVNRKYKERWAILIENNYEPTHDVHRDWQGLLVFYEGHYKLRDDIVNYFNQRNEDSIDT
jgi:hypothetical protein